MIHLAQILPFDISAGVFQDWVFQNELALWWTTLVVDEEPAFALQGTEMVQSPHQDLFAELRSHRQILLDEVLPFRICLGPNPCFLRLLHNKAKERSDVVAPPQPPSAPWLCPRS